MSLDKPFLVCHRLPGNYSLINTCGAVLPKLYFRVAHNSTGTREKPSAARLMSALACMRQSRTHVDPKRPNRVR